MSLSREKLVNIQIFMARAVEAGGVRSASDAMAFAETLEDVSKEIAAIDKKNPPKKVEEKK